MDAASDDSPRESSSTGTKSDVGAISCSIVDDTMDGMTIEREGTEFPLRDDTVSSELEDMERLIGPDFSKLPEVAWVQIMSYLPLYEQYIVSQTCLALYDVFNHPSLWHTTKIKLFGSHDNYSRGYDKILIPSKYTKLVNRFGNFFKHITLIILGYLNKFPDSWVSVMHELSKQCRLESLTLEIGQLTSSYHIGGYQPSAKDLSALLSFVRHAFRLKHLQLKSWPMYPDSLSNKDLNIFEVLLQNPKLKDLESLNLFWCKSTEWSERMPILPSPEATLPLVQNFRSLTRLSLRSPMLDKDIILELSKIRRTNLKLLQIFVHFTPGSSIFKIPEISTSAWKQFVLANPEVEVECTMLQRTPHFELAAMLKPDCPLSAITFMKYSRCDSQIVTSLSDMYHRSLKKFACYCDPTCKESEVVSLVMRSPNLKHFVYYGHISCVSIEMLAELRGTQWQDFVIPSSCVTMPDVPVYDDDDDRVIAPGEDGEYYLVCLARFHQSVSADEERTKAMEQKVSAALQYNWKPI